MRLLEVLFRKEVFMEVKKTEKYNLLWEYMLGITKENICVAFSGGVDSALLLKMACDAGEENNTSVFAITANTMLHPKGDIEIAENLANDMGAVFKTVKVDELRDAGIENNPPNRCYLCKREIFRKIKEKCREYGVKTIIEGTNSDDLNEYRPGIKALKELEIVSPLAELGICKKEVREMAGLLGISVANRPSTPCLATRLPYNSTINYELLERINDGENFIRNLGFYNVRLRIHDCIARIEVDYEDIEKLVSYKEQVTEYLKKLGYKYVTVDLNGFMSGSME